MKTTLIALALLALGIVPPASAKQAAHHSRAINARAQMPTAKQIVDRVPMVRGVDASGRLHDPDMDWELRNEEMHGLW